MSLYDLPKDLLVKLVTEIQEKTIKETLLEIKEITKGAYQLHFCTVTDCPFYLIYGVCSGNYYNKDYSKDFLKCKNCWRKFCKKHFSENMTYCSGCENTFNRN